MKTKFLITGFLTATLNLFGALPSASAAELTVDTTADTVDANPGDGVCADAGGNCSLRAAILEANALASGDVIDVPAGTYTLTGGTLVITDGVTIRGAGSNVTFIDGSNAGGVLRVGSILYNKTIDTGAVANFTNSFVNCLAAEGCLGKPGLVDVGGSDPIAPISFDFTLTPAEMVAVNGATGRGVLSVTASRDIGRKIAAVASDVLPATLDGTGVGDLFRDTIDTCPTGENFNPINFFCGPNFHNDFAGTDSLFISQTTFRNGAGDGQVQIVFSPPGTPPGGPANAGTGRLKIFSVRLLYVKDFIVNLNGLTVQNGDAGGAGGGIRNDGGIVQASDLVVKDNSAFSAGGGIFNNIGTVTLVDSTIRDNRAGTLGGGVVNASLGILKIDRSTISNNAATQGAGILNSGRLTLTNSTLSGNTARLGGGGLQNTATADLSFCTVTANVANNPSTDNASAVGGGIRNALDGRINIANTILAGNSDNRFRGLALLSPDCFSAVDFRFTSHRDNLVGVLNGNCILKDTIFGDTSFNQVGTEAAPLDPRLAALADNGGPTRTHALLARSPAIDADQAVTSATFFDCPETDQRGVDRPQGPACDIGSFEAGPDLSVAKTDSPDPVLVTDRLIYTVTVNNAGPADASGVTATDTLPAGVSFVSATPTQGSCGEASGIVTCDLGDVANGASANVTIVVMPTVKGMLSNTVEVTGDETDENPDNNTDTEVTTVTPPVPAVTCNGLRATIVGTFGNDILSGTPGNDVIHGRGGNDTIRGLGGRDVICGGAGDDRLFGDQGKDQLFGGAGNDVLMGGTGNDRLFGQSGDDALDGGLGSDDNCNGGSGTDTATSCEQPRGVP